MLAQSDETVAKKEGRDERLAAVAIPGAQARLAGQGHARAFRHALEAFAAEIEEAAAVAADRTAPLAAVIPHRDEEHGDLLEPIADIEMAGAAAELLGVGQLRDGYDLLL